MAGKISRDIGFRFTMTSRFRTTHKIDPDVDKSRDYLVEDLAAAGIDPGARLREGCGHLDHRASGAQFDRRSILQRQVARGDLSRKRAGAHRGGRFRQVGEPAAGQALAAGQVSRQREKQDVV